MEIKRYLLLAGLCSLLFGCSDEPEEVPTQASPTIIQTDPDAETKRLNAWLEQKYLAQMRFTPVEKTFYGIKDEDYGHVNDFSDKGLDETLTWRRQTLSELKANFNYEALSDTGKDSYDLWAYLTERDLAASQFRANEFIFDHVNGLHSALPELLIVQHQVNTVEDMDAYLSRLSASARAIEQLLERAKQAASNDIRPPYFAFDIVTEEAKRLITGKPFEENEEEALLWQDVKSKAGGLLEAGKIDDDKALEILRTARDTLLKKWLPAYQALIEWQIEDRTNASEAASGAGALPDGEVYYTERLTFHTTTDMSANEIHQFGLDNVKRLYQAMERIKLQLGFEGDMQAFFALLRDSKEEPRFYFPNTDEGRQAYLDESAVAIANIKSQLPDYFALLPKTELIVKRVESFREQAGAPQHYVPGALDGNRPGIYYTHLLDMTAMPRYELEVVAYHESIPGHHIQVAIADEMENIPLFRKHVFINAFAEGWGLYAERLAGEMNGTYQDPYAKFSSLELELWRTVRLVTDTGLHAKGWTEQQAIEYLLKNSTASETLAQQEVRRYIVWPGQATSYMVGMLKILELRKKARYALGDAFDIKIFHDIMLRQGTLPFNLLEKKINQWIAQHYCNCPTG
ncbi:MAG: DUF885 domain-containing protein [Pseudomonadota bacterium]